MFDNDLEDIEDLEKEHIASALQEKPLESIGDGMRPGPDPTAITLPH